MAKNEEEAAVQKRSKAMSDSARLLDLLSAGGDGLGKHSPCLFCRHRGMETCPYGTTQKFESCPDFTARHRAKVMEHKILTYLCNPAQEVLQLERAA